MDPQTPSGQKAACPARGQVGQGNSRVHRWQEQRYRCDRCRATFSARKGTPCSRLQTAADPVTLVLTRRCPGGPLQAVVAAFGLDERTVAPWQARAGQHCQRVQEHWVLPGPVDRQHVQAAELWVNRVGRRGWRALARAVPARLGLGGGGSPHRDGALLSTRVAPSRASARSLAILVCVDGRASYVTAFTRGFRHPVYTGRRGRPRLVVERGLLLGQVVKRYVKRRGGSVQQRVVRGTAAAIAAGLTATGGGPQLNTADRERLNATFRRRLALLVRRGRALARTEAMLTAGRYLVGCAYNCCSVQESLRLAAPLGTGAKWQQRTPAMAAGLTDQCWTRAERLHYQVPLPTWVAPKRRGRPRKHARPPGLAPAA